MAARLVKSYWKSSYKQAASLKQTKKIQQNRSFSLTLFLCRLDGRGKGRGVREGGRGILAGAFFFQKVIIQLDGNIAGTAQKRPSSRILKGQFVSESQTLCFPLVPVVSLLSAGIVLTGVAQHQMFEYNPLGYYAMLRGRGSWCFRSTPWTDPSYWQKVTEKSVRPYKCLVFLFFLECESTLP